MLRPFARAFKLICDFNITDQTYLSDPGDDYNGLFFCVLLKKPLNTLTIKKASVFALQLEICPMEWNDPGSGIRENFAYEIRNPRLLNPQYSSRNPESH